jgi:hypothetical protein
MVLLDPRFGMSSIFLILLITGYILMAWFGSERNR